jgi:hypothetical protein
MCCIIHRPKGAKKIPDSNIESIIKINSDGWGIAYIRNGTVFFSKSMKMEDAKDKIRKLEKEDLEFLFHARYATHGDKSIENCHPYKSADGLLFHNGKIDIHCHNKKFSDTYYFARKVSKYLRKGRTIESILKRFNKMIGQSRLAFITSKGKIIKHGKWYEEDGCEYSKLNWKYRYNNYYEGNDWFPYGGYGNTEKYVNKVKTKTFNKFNNGNFFGKKPPFEETLDNCKQGKILYFSLVSKLTEGELMALAAEYPKLCAEYLSRMQPFHDNH